VREDRDEIERLRDIARVVIAERVRRWRASEDLQFQYSLRAYTGMTREEWLAWKNDDSKVTNRMARMWGRTP